MVTGRDMNRRSTASSVALERERLVQPLLDHFSKPAKRISAGAAWYYGRPPGGERVPSFPWLLKESQQIEEGLCDTCKLLDFGFLFSKQLDRIFIKQDDEVIHYTDGVDLGWIKTIREKGHCKFCTTIWRSIVHYKSGEHIPDFRTNSKGKTFKVDCTLHNLRRGVWGEIGLEDALNEPHAFQLEINADTGDGPMPVGFIQQLETGLPCSGRRVGNTINRGLVTQWLERCLKEHRCSASENGQLGLLRVIDTQRKCLTSITVDADGPDYVALSYVWGKEPFLTLTRDTRAELERDGSFSSPQLRISKTVRNAVQLCENLGEHYLWVDALCIVQDEVEPKLYDLSRMDKIYSYAKFTIVAASGAGASSGLSGVSAPRAAQNATIVRGRMFATVFPDWNTAVNSTIWDTRAWTYQERLLSRRLLFLSESQAYFQCRRCIWREDMDLDSIPIGADETFPHAVEDLDQTDFMAYRQLVAEYSKRALTYAEDVHNALKGINAVLEWRSLDSASMQNTFPMALLDVALLWIPAGPLRPRLAAAHSQDALHQLSLDDFKKKGFSASWNWTGWIGPVEYFEYISIAERTKRCCRVLGFEGHEELAGMHPATVEEGWKREISEDFGIHYSHSSAPRRLYCRPVSMGQSPWIMNERFLTIEAQIAEFNMSLDHTPHFNPRSGPRYCGGGNHEACYLSIQDAHGVNCGAVVVDGNTVKQLKPGKYKFVKLSQTTLMHDEDDPAWDEETQSFAGKPGSPARNPKGRSPFGEIFDQVVYDPDVCWCLYNIMMIEGSRDEGFRMGIGQMHIHAFDAANPEVRGIKLW